MSFGKSGSSAGWFSVYFELIIGEMTCRWIGNAHYSKLPKKTTTKVSLYHLSVSLIRQVYSWQSSCHLVFYVGCLPFLTDSDVSQVHTPVWGWGYVQVLKTTDILHNTSTPFFAFKLFLSRTFGLPFHPSHRWPRFDPGIFSVWCTIIRPSPHSSHPTLLCLSAMNRFLSHSTPMSFSPGF